MSGGTTEVHKDDDYLMSGTHDGADSASVLRDMDADFKSCGVRTGLYIENVTQSENALVGLVNETEITTTDGTGIITIDGEQILIEGQTIAIDGGNLSWNKGDTYKIYKTATKGQVISTNWVDLSRGWKTPKRELDRGWREEDIDIDRDMPGRVFGPGQPSKDHR